MTEVLTPDFDSYRWIPITEVDSDVPMVRVHWPDGVSIDCFALWLFENTVAIDPITRESMIDPGSLPDASVLVDADLDQGALRLTWRDGQVSTVHPGWLRSVAEGHHVPGAVAELVTWDASIGEPPTFDGSEVLHDDAALEAWVAALVSHGLARLRSTAADREEMERIGRRIGPIRGSNIGDVFSVEAVSDEADSLANTGSNLGRHSDLPTRETPPGYQFLHCVENSVAGGPSRMTDGLSVIARLRAEHAEHYAALTMLEWVFANRAKDGDHRWIGSIIDHGTAQSLLTLRAFYPVRLAPRMDAADVPRAYEAMRVLPRPRRCVSRLRVLQRNRRQTKLT